MFKIIFFGGFFIFAIVFFAIGFGMLIKRKRKEENYSGVASGTVVDNEIRYSRSTEGYTYSHYHPVIEYYANGALIKNTYFVGTGSAKYYPGQKITIKYDINNPTKFYIEGEKTTLIIGSAFLSFGILTMVITVILSIFIN